MIIELKNVTKIYKLGKAEVVALKNIDLTFDEEEFIGIIGPSGSGKTTLLNIIGGIDVPTEGDVFIEGVNIKELSDTQLTLLRRKKIGFIFQTFNLIPVFNSFENVELSLVMEDIDVKEREKKVKEILKLVGLDDLTYHRPDELSGGQRQRVAIARALVKEPKIVIADEPTANLDWDTGNKIVEIMREMCIKKKVTFLIATHDPRVLKYLNKKIFLADGKIERIEKI